METLESLQRKITGAGELKSVVRTMKAMAASRIGEYEMAVSALGDYYRNLALALSVCFRQPEIAEFKPKAEANIDAQTTAFLLVFGSEQGLIGPYNEKLTEFVKKSSSSLAYSLEAWAIGARIEESLQDQHIEVSKLFPVPNSVDGITSLVVEILSNIEETREKGPAVFYIFHNQPKTGVAYEQIKQRLLPFDREWQQEFSEINWPNNNLPEVLGDLSTILSNFIKEYIFVSIYKASAESLASESAARLAAMQRAETNIRELLEDLKNDFHRLRQTSIDEELFDVISGFEALNHHPEE
ncbi:MAG: F0F1 ATP synthase subunit gamma [Salinimicrobium sp.]